VDAEAPITRLLQDIDAGRPGAMDELMRVVHADLERVAAAHLRRRFGARAQAVTLEPAAIVNESFLKLIRHRQQYDSRGHFFATATKVMLHVLLDYVDQRNAQKRGGDRDRISFSLAERDAADRNAGAGGTIEVGLQPMVRALAELEKLDARKADVVKMRVIWGMTNDEIAESLGVSRPTAERDWRFAKSWLAEQARDAATTS